MERKIEMTAPPPPTVESVRAVLKTIFDPEIHLSVLDLGLIYDVVVQADGKKGHRINIRMTLTTPACPYGPALLSKVHADVGAIPGVSDVNVDLAWIPPWDPRTMASDEAKLKMGMFELDNEDDEISVEPSSPGGDKSA
jgi:metal-sulfur cluster biosynthetic enzyme